jgi:hypothetical protein
MNVGLDRRVAEGTRHRNAVVAVQDEVLVADPVDLDGRYREAALVCRGDAQPSGPGSVRARAEAAVEVLAPAVDGPDD